MYRSHVFLASALVGGEWSASLLGRFTPVERFPRNPLERRLVDPRAGLDDAGKRKFVTPPGLKHRLLGCPARSQSLYRMRYPGSTPRRCNAKLSWALSVSACAKLRSHLPLGFQHALPCHHMHETGTRIPNKNFLYFSQDFSSRSILSSVSRGMSFGYVMHP
jgi:hypothetical protein